MGLEIPIDNTPAIQKVRQGMRQAPVRKGSSTKTVQSVITPGTDLMVPEYEAPTDFKTKLEAATEKIKAYKAFFYNRDHLTNINEESSSSYKAVPIVN